MKLLSATESVQGERREKEIEEKDRKKEHASHTSTAIASSPSPRSGLSPPPYMRSDMTGTDRAERRQTETGEEALSGSVERNTFERGSY